MNGSDIVITYNGTNITSSCLFAEASFEAQMAAVPGAFSVTVSDKDQTLDFTTGKELTLDIDGSRQYGGYVMQVTKKYAFPADDTTHGTDVVQSRQWLLTGVDYNVLFDKLVLRNTANYTHNIPVLTGSPTDGEVIRDHFATYFDLPAGFDFSNATYIIDNHTFSTTGHYTWKQQGTTMRDVMDDLAQYGSVYWIDANKQLNYLPVQDVAAEWGFSDNPNDDPIGVGTPTRGFRDGEYTEDASAVANDALVWGGSEWAAGGDVVFDRETNSTSITNHGRWQVAEVRVGDANYKIFSEVQARARVIVNGNASGTFAEGSQGLVNPEKQFRCTWFSIGVPTSGGDPVHLLPGQVVPIELWVFSQDDGVTPFLAALPLRQVTITFPNLDPQGDAYAQFDGYFGVLMADPYWLWAFVRRSQRQLSAPNIVSSATNASTDPPYGAQYQDVPSPAADSSTTVFTIPFGYIARTSQFFVNGVLLLRGTEYTENDSTAGEFTLTTAPTTGAVLWVTATLTG